MAKYVKLTTKGGSAAWINLHNVASIIEKDSGSAIYFAGDEDPVNVRENPDQILQLPFTEV